MTNHITLNGKHHTQWEKSPGVPLKIKSKTGISAFTSLIQHSTGSPSHSNQTRKINKRHPNWKGGSKTCLLYTSDAADDPRVV